MVPNKDGDYAFPDVDPITQICKDYIAAHMKNLDNNKIIDEKEQIWQDAATLEELRRDLFLRRKRRKKLKEFNHEREQDRKAVETIMAAPIPINKALLLKENKTLSRKQTKLKMRLQQLGINKEKITDFDALDNEIGEKIKLAMKTELKPLSLPNGAMTDFQLEMVFSRVYEKNPDTNYDNFWKDCAQCYI